MIHSTCGGHVGQRATAGFRSVWQVTECGFSYTQRGKARETIKSWCLLAKVVSPIDFSQETASKVVGGQESSPKCCLPKGSQIEIHAQTTGFAARFSAART